MVDYQFLGMVAVALAVVTRGAVLPVVLVTTVVAIMMLVHEACARRRRRHTRAADLGAAGSPASSDTELTRWMAVMDRVLRSND